MLLPNIIKVPSKSDWLLTFPLVNPYDNKPATNDNTYVRFGLYDKPLSDKPVWSCGWDTGIQNDPVKPGVVHIHVPRDISDFLPTGIYTYVVNVVSKDHPTYSRAGSGTLESVKMDPKGGIEFGVSDNVARRMVGEESVRAMKAEEEIREDISVINPDPIPDDCVSTVKIQNLAVTTAKIADGAVTPEKLAGGTIKAGMIEDGTITGRKIADETIGANKLDPTLIADIDSVAQALLPKIQIGNVTHGDSFSVQTRIESGMIFLDFVLVPGATPEISQENMWVIDGVSTEVPATGENGISIDHVEKVQSTSDDTDTYRIFFSRDGHLEDYTFDFYIPNPGNTTDTVIEGCGNPISSGSVYNQVIRNAPQRILSSQSLAVSVNSQDLTITSGKIVSAFNLDGVGTPVELYNEDTSVDTVCSRISYGSLASTSVQYRFEASIDDPSNIVSIDILINDYGSEIIASGTVNTSDSHVCHFIKGATQSIDNGFVNIEFTYDDANGEQTIALELVR